MAAVQRSMELCPRPPPRPPGKGLGTRAAMVGLRALRSLSPRGPALQWPAKQSGSQSLAALENELTTHAPIAPPRSSLWRRPSPRSGGTLTPRAEPSAILAAQAQFEASAASMQLPAVRQRSSTPGALSQQPTHDTVEPVTSSTELPAVRQASPRHREVPFKQPLAPPRPFVQAPTASATSGSGTPRGTGTPVSGSSPHSRRRRRCHSARELGSSSELAEISASASGSCSARGASSSTSCRTEGRVDAPSSTRGRGGGSTAGRRSESAGVDVLSSWLPKAPAVEERRRAAEQIGEGAQLQEHAQQLLDAVFDFPMAEDAALFMLGANPELAWLAQCVQRCPLPTCWSALESRNGSESTRYVDMGTGTVTDLPPMLHQFVELARVMLFWRSNPGQAHLVSERLATKYSCFLLEAEETRQAWSGPHVDPGTDIEFWHCPATQRSTWGDPGAAAEFLARVIDKLRQALPKESETTEASAASAQKHKRGSADDAEWALREVGPGIRHERSSSRKPRNDQKKGDQKWNASEMPPEDNTCFFASDPLEMPGLSKDLHLRAGSYRRRPQSCERLEPITHPPTPRGSLACQDELTARGKNAVFAGELQAALARVPQAAPEIANTFEAFKLEMQPNASRRLTSPPEVSLDSPASESCELLPCTLAAQAASGGGTGACSTAGDSCNLTRLPASDSIVQKLDDIFAATTPTNANMVLSSQDNASQQPDAELARTKAELEVEAAAEHAAEKAAAEQAAADQAWAEKVAAEKAADEEAAAEQAAEEAAAKHAAEKAAAAQAAVDQAAAEKVAGKKAAAVLAKYVAEKAAAEKAAAEKAAAEQAASEKAAADEAAAEQAAVEQAAAEQAAVEQAAADKAAAEQAAADRAAVEKAALEKAVAEEAAANQAAAEKAAAEKAAADQAASEKAAAEKAAAEQAASEKAAMEKAALQAAAEQAAAEQAAAAQAAGEKAAAEQAAADCAAAEKVAAEIAAAEQVAADQAAAEQAAAERAALEKAAAEQAAADRAAAEKAAAEKAAEEQAAAEQAAAKQAAAEQAAAEKAAEQAAAEQAAAEQAAAKHATEKAAAEQAAAEKVAAEQAASDKAAAEKAAAEKAAAELAAAEQVAAEEAAAERAVVQAAVQAAANQAAAEKAAAEKAAADQAAAEQAAAEQAAEEAAAEQAAEKAAAEQAAAQKMAALKSLKYGDFLEVIAKEQDGASTQGLTCEEIESGMLNLEVAEMMVSDEPLDSTASPQELGASSNGSSTSMAASQQGFKTWDAQEAVQEPDLTILEIGGDEAIVHDQASASLAAKVWDAEMLSEEDGGMLDLEAVERMVAGDEMLDSSAIVKEFGTSSNESPILDASNEGESQLAQEPEGGPIISPTASLPSSGATYRSALSQEKSMSSDSEMKSLPSIEALEEHVVTQEVEANSIESGRGRDLFASFSSGEARKTPESSGHLFASLSGGSGQLFASLSSGKSSDSLSGGSGQLFASLSSGKSSDMATPQESQIEQMKAFSDHGTGSVAQVPPNTDACPQRTNPNSAAALSWAEQVGYGTAPRDLDMLEELAWGPAPGFEEAPTTPEALAAGITSGSPHLPGTIGSSPGQIVRPKKPPRASAYRATPTKLETLQEEIIAEVEGSHVARSGCLGVPPKVARPRGCGRIVSGLAPVGGA